MVFVLLKKEKQIFLEHLLFEINENHTVLKKKYISFKLHGPFVKKILPISLINFNKYLQSNFFKDNIKFH
jgi:hypothetical protein